MTIKSGTRLKEIKSILRKIRGELEAKYGVKEIGIFGSYSRDEQNSGSDIDILVEFSQPIGLIKFLELENHLQEKLGIKVDLVTRNALKPHIGRHILSSVNYL